MGRLTRILMSASVDLGILGVVIAAVALLGQAPEEARVRHGRTRYEFKGRSVDVAARADIIT